MERKISKEHIIVDEICFFCQTLLNKIVPSAFKALVHE